MLFSIFAFAGAVRAPFSTTNLGINVTPDLRDRNSRFENRATTAYDAANNRLIVGSTDSGANEHAISALTTSDSGATVSRAALAPALIYSNPSNTSAGFIANPVYNARIWELAYSSAYGKSYVTAIVQPAGEMGNGGSFLAVINVADARETYVSGTAMTLNNELTDPTTNTASRFVKLAIGDNNAVNAKIAFVAVADSATGEFDTSKTTVGLRGFTLPNSALSNNSLVELDMNSSGVAATKGVRLGSTAAMMTVNMRRLTSMVWDTTVRALYLGGHMTGGTLGICGFYLASSDVLTTLNNTSGPGGTLLNADAASSIIPDLSHVHRIIVTRLGTGIVPHLIVQAGSSPQEKNKFYVLSLANRVSGGVYTAGSDGKLAVGTTGTSIASARSHLWVAQATNGSVSSANAARGILGNAPFPLRNSSTIITDFFSVSTAASTQNVFVTTYNARSGSELWVSTITHSSNYASSSTAWRRVADSAMVNVTAFATDATNLWAILDRRSVYTNSTTAASAAVVQPSLGLANVKDAHTRLRQVAVFDAVNRTLISGATSAPGASTSPVSSFSPATGVTSSPAGEAAVAQLLNQPVWDVVTMTNSGVVDRYYLLHDTVVATKGGKTIIKVPGDGSAATVFTTATFFQDTNGSASRCVKMVAGQDSAGTNRLFCFIADASAADSAIGATGGTNGGGGASPSADVVKVLDKDLGVVAASLQLGDVSNLPGLRRTDGFSTPSDVVTIQSVYFDYTLKVLYVGFQIANGINNKPGLIVLKLSNAPALTGYMVFTSGYNGSTLGTDDSIRDAYKISSLRTNGTTARSILLVAGTLTAQPLTTSAETGDLFTAGVYAIPVITAVGGNLGKAATGAGTYTTNAVATSTSNMWNKSVSPSLFYVGGYVHNATPALAGGGYPWNLRAAVLDIQVVSHGTALTSPQPDVYVTVANPPGISGPAGVFRTTPICDAAGALQGWMPWTPVAGLRDSMQNVVFDQTTGAVIGLDLASGQPIIPAWKASTESSAYDQFADSLNTDFADNGGVYSLETYSATEGIVSANATGTGATMHLVIATGNKKVALAHIGYKSASASLPLVTSNPNKSDANTYKLFSGDAALNEIGQVYCSTMSRGSSGWVFVGGKNGVAVLRVPGTVGGHSGKGWTTSVPTSLVDATSSGTGLAGMTWFKVAGITDSIRKMTLVYDRTTGNEVVVAMGARGVYAFVANNANLFDDTTANAPAIVSLTTFTSGASERVWDLTPLYHRAGVLLVGTTKGLYRVQFDNGAWTTPVEIVDSVDSLSLGGISSIHVTSPALAAGSDLSVNPIFTVNCVTAKARTDGGRHYRFPITLNETTGAIVGSSAAVLVRELDRMVSQVIADGASTIYHAGKPTARAASVDVLSKVIETSSAAVSGGLTAPRGTGMGNITVLRTDGAKLVTVGGRVHVQSA